MPKLVDDLDVYRTANVLIKQHGSNAVLFATGQADELLEKGDMDGAVVWRRISRAVEQLRRQRREGELLN